MTAHPKKVPCCPPCCWDRACVCCIAASRSLLQQPTDSSMVFLYFINYKTSIIRALCCRHTSILSSLPRLYTFKQFYHCYQTRLVVGREDIKTTSSTRCHLSLHICHGPLYGCIQSDHHCHRALLKVLSDPCLMQASTTAYIMFMKHSPLCRLAIG